MRQNGHWRHHAVRQRIWRGTKADRLAWLHNQPANVLERMMDHVGYDRRASRLVKGLMAQILEPALRPLDALPLLRAGGVHLDEVLESDFEV